ncbi:hypothetical protein B5M09_009942 [Aphanomyces astaci]|uniref:Cytochrome b561 bacterial/Ni-hydrogenase domain-containing protein n=1 Tax=Aphanomyces astaci TaxID=112090 RepID=A0A425DLX8_APHAT|nr:hypothetical protein B5M09_009942 [Aphanomyces astaci]
MVEESSPIVLGKVQTVITHFFSGTVAGVTGAVAGYPLDTIKSRMQTQMHLPSTTAGSRITPLQALVHSIRQEGFLSLYRGASTQVARQAIGCSILFGLMAQFKWLFYTPSTGVGSAEAHPQIVLAASAACTGVVEASIYCPFEITMIRMQAVKGLYRGFTPTCCREVVGNTVYFLTYDRVKDQLQAKTQLTPMHVYGTSGAVAGFAYWCVSFPLDTIKSVVQADVLDRRHQKYLGTMDCASKLYREGGVGRFFRGLSPCLLRAMPVNAVQFMSFEKTVEMLTPLWPHSPDGTAYARSTSVFHWVVAGVFGGVVGTVKLAQNTTDKVEKLRLMNLHKSLAVIAAVLVPARIGTRLLTRSPQALAGPKWEQLLGSASHLGLYGLMIGLPSSGIAMGYYSGFGIPFFGSRIPGAEKPDKSISGPAYSAHKTMGQALVYFVPLHVGAAFFHHFRGAQIFQRINPFKASK